MDTYDTILETKEAKEAEHRSEDPMDVLHEALDDADVKPPVTFDDWASI